MFIVLFCNFSMFESFQNKMLKKKIEKEKRWPFGLKIELRDLRGRYRMKSLYEKVVTIKT